MTMHPPLYRQDEDGDWDRVREPLPTTAAPGRIELGCGSHKNEGYFGIDRVDLAGVNLVHDLNVRPWPLEDECATAVIAHQTLEHIADLIACMAEVWRICRPDAWVEIVVPYYASAGAHGDPTHCHTFSETSFLYWEPGFVEGFSDYGIAHHFGIVDQAWRLQGNLWVLLRPIKTAAQLAAWQEEDEWRRHRSTLVG